MKPLLPPFCALLIVLASALASTNPGHQREHYGLSDQMEFFAEMTEAYFGSNDFYPFVTGELKQAEPETFALIAKIWGPLPELPQPKTKAKP